MPSSGVPINSHHDASVTLWTTFTIRTWLGYLNEERIRPPSSNARSSPSGETRALYFYLGADARESPRPDLGASHRLRVNRQLGNALQPSNSAPSALRLRTTRTPWPQRGHGSESLTVLMASILAPALFASHSS